MKVVFFATTNRGKQQEIRRLAASYKNRLTVVFPDSSNQLEVEEFGNTFKENALLKAEAYRQVMGQKGLIFVGDDSGLKIPAFNGEPGVHTHRWAGHEMTDDEVLQYCLERMKDLSGEDRRAVFETVLVAIYENGNQEVFRGEMWGRIAEQSVVVAPVAGFPFRSVFWVEGANCLIADLHDPTYPRPAGFVTHREAALRQLFEALAK